MRLPKQEYRSRLKQINVWTSKGQIMSYLVHCWSTSTIVLCCIYKCNAHPQHEFYCFWRCYAENALPLLAPTCTYALFSEICDSVWSKFPERKILAISLIFFFLNIYIHIYCTVHMQLFNVDTFTYIQTDIFWWIPKCHID